VALGVGGPRDWNLQSSQGWGGQASSPETLQVEGGNYSAGNQSVLREKNATKIVGGSQRPQHWQGPKGGRNEIRIEVL